jgi:hypothetical protein
LVFCSGLVDLHPIRQRVSFPHEIMPAASL